jgi:hypothetical protein
MSVKIFKLMTGEEIVAEITNESDSSVSLKNCVALVLQPSRDGKLGFGFVPFGAMVDGDITISKDKLLFTAEASDDLKNNYNSMFGGIVTPPKTLITG